MTGYGEASRETERFVIAVEVRTVNNRFLKVNPKIPEEIAFIQNRLEERIRKRVVRGSIFLAVRFEPTDRSELYEIDRSVLEKYLTTIDEIKRQLRREEVVTLRDILLLPGVVRSEESLIPEKEDVLPVAESVLEDALGQLLAMRELEGANLEAELRVRTRRLDELLVAIRKEAPKAIEEHHLKLEQRVKALLRDQKAALAPEDLIKETAIVAERADIAEEVSRMQSHVQQFGESLGSDQPVGRKLEFIVQEMFREANTMGSKATSSELGRHIVDLKAEVDRIKEQVANIE